MQEVKKVSSQSFLISTRDLLTETYEAPETTSNSRAVRVIIPKKRKQENAVQESQESMYASFLMNYKVNSRLLLKQSLGEEECEL